MVKHSRRYRYGAAIAGGCIGLSLIMTSTPAGAAVTSTPYYSGYIANPGPFTSASATFTVPKLVCSAGENAAVDPDAIVNNYNGKTTTREVQVGVRLECVKGVVTYQVTYQMNGVRHLPAMTIKAGNEIKETAKQSSASASATLEDVTTNKTVTATGAGGKDDFASVLADGVAKSTTNPAIQDVPNFGTIKFTSATINGAGLSASSPIGYQRVDPSNHVEIQTSAISGGSSFTSTFRRSS